MDKRILETLLLFALLDAVFIVVSGGRFCNNPSPPVCADDCDGNGYYLNEDETACIQCLQCPPGEELNKACGNGLNGDAICLPCRDGFFSSSTSKQCTPCTTCINTLEREPCQLTQDRVCGDCLPGFVRSSDRFSIDPNACPDRCSDLPRDAPQCSDWWNSQQEGPVEEDLHLEHAPTEQPVEVVPLDWPDACEPEPPQCIDHCHDGNYYLDYDGMCKSCLQCQPGEELNKVCGRGENGDAYCQRCPEGTFSVDGLGRCTPCRICVNTVATECTSTRDSECGECLPGYYQDADGFFPDQGACPNKCIECPTTIPQCQEWCEPKKDPGEVTTIIFIGQDAVSPQAVEADVFQPDTDKEEINNEEDGSPSANHASSTIIIALASIIAVITIILAVILIVFRSLWKKTAVETTLLPGPSATSSPGSTPRIVYSPTVYPMPPAENALEFMTYLRTLSSAAFQNLTGSRPASGSSIDVENRSSVASTPTMNLNRRLSNRDPLRDTPRRQFGTDHEHDEYSSWSNPQHQFPDPWAVKEEHALVNSDGGLINAGPVDIKENHPTQSATAGKSDRDSRSKVTTEESENVHRNLQDQVEAPGIQVRRRHSNNINSSSNDPKPKDNRSKSLPGLHLGSGFKKSRKESYVNNARGPEREAALFPPDSTSDDGPTINVPADTDNNKSANPKNLGRYLEPTASPYTTPPCAADTKPRATNSTLATLPEITPPKITPPGGMVNTGNKSPGETNVTIHINMITKDVDTFHVGDVHNRHNYAHQTDSASEPHDEDGDQDEVEKLLNINTTETDAIPGHNGNDDRDDIGEEGKLLDP